MARKIPLERTIGGAYGFLFGNLVSVIGIVWLPYLLFGSLAVGVLWYSFVLHPLPSLSFDEAHVDLVQIRSFVRALIRPLVAAGLLFGVGTLMATLGLTKKALGKMPGATLVYFNLGSGFWRLFAAYLLAIACFVGLALLLAVIGAIWGMTGARFVPAPLGSLIAAIGSLAAVLFCIYAVIRLMFFIPAVVAAEDRIGLLRSWQLGRGNFWRIFAVLLLIVIPSLIVYGVFDAVVRAVFFGRVMEVQQAMIQQAVAGRPVDVNAMIHSLVSAALQAGPVAWAMALLVPILFAIALRALYAGATATAYLGMTESETSSPS